MSRVWSTVGEGRDAQFRAPPPGGAAVRPVHGVVAVLLDARHAAGADADARDRGRADGAVPRYRGVQGGRRHRTGEGGSGGGRGTGKRGV